MPDSVCKEYKIALFGAGRIGQIHAKNITSHPQSQLSVVVDINAQAANVLAEKYGAEVSSEEQVFASDSIDGVLIASATQTHADLIERAARSGKKIFCEKPIDLNLERVEQCLQVVNQNKASLLVGFNRRFDKNFAALKQQLDDGEIGKPELVLINSRDPGLPPLDYIKVSGGLFKDMSIHDIDMACWLMQETPSSVSASGACLIEPDVARANDIDTGVITLQFPKGEIAVITNSRRTTYGYDQRIEVHGSEGMLFANNEIESTVVKANQQGIVSQKPLHFFLERYANAYRCEWDHFVNVLSGRVQPSVSGEDGRNALIIAEAANEAILSGNRQSMSF